MRVGVLIGPSLRAMYVANRLCAALPVVTILRETGRDWSWRNLRRQLQPGALRNRVYRKLRPWLFPPDVDAARFFFGADPPRFVRADLVQNVACINDRCVVDRLRGAAVDFIAVFGTSLIRNRALFQLAPGRTLNLHGGVSPWYRGADSTFWALSQRDFANIGCTIHQIVRRIDAGAIIADYRPAVHPGDSETRLFYETIRRGADVYAEAIARLAAGEALGVSQPPGGQLFLTRHRTWVHDRALHRCYRAQPFPDVTLPPRTTWYPGHTAGSMGLRPVGRELRTSHSE
jgi:hypothetical protein